MLAVHMQQAFCPCSFVQVVDILGDNQQTTVPFGIKLRQRMMCSIGLFRLDCLTPHIIKTQHQVGVALERLRRCHILNSVLFP